MNITRAKRYAHIFWYLLRTDLTVLRQTIFDRFIDMLIWICVMSGIAAYLLPAFGLSSGYVNFYVAGLVASMGIFELFGNVVKLVNDLDGVNITGFYLSLPMPPILVFVRSIVFYALNAGMLSSFVLPVCKLLLGARVDLSHFHLPKFLLIFCITNIFYGAFTLFVATRVRNIERIGTAWMRFVFPLWQLGCFQFSWTILHEKFPLIAMLNVCNPVVYIMEGMRAAILGQEGFLNFWLCCTVLTVLTLIMTFVSIRLFKKKLDF
ncbi:MAG: ABC transporter permease [Candidatus Babeliales bacterium]